MCQYSAVDGLPNDWHIQHYGSRAVGGAGLLITEATGVLPEGRISPQDTGLWNDEQQAVWARIAKFIDSQGCVPGIQLAHAGRKASCSQPWRGGNQVSAQEGGWTPVAPSAVPFKDSDLAPHELSVEEITALRGAFVSSTQRAIAAGFRVIELHFAHGYLVHEFLSPLSNKRTDAYGGDFAGRARLSLEITADVRTAMPDDLPLFVRISASDWVADSPSGSWDVDQSVKLCCELKAIGADLIDVSSGGLSLSARMSIGPGYQVPFAERIRKEAGIPTGAVGLITEPRQAEEIIGSGQADIVLLARELLRDPYWPLHAAKELGVDVEWPLQYQRAKK